MRSSSTASAVEAVLCRNLLFNLIDSLYHVLTKLCGSTAGISNKIAGIIAVGIL